MEPWPSTRLILRCRGRAGPVPPWSGCFGYSTRQGIEVSVQGGVQRGGQVTGPLLALHVVLHEVDRAGRGVGADLVGADEPDDGRADRVVLAVDDGVPR